MATYYKQPKYFSDFHCIGGDCTYSCCDGWGVFWYEKELEHLKSAEMSDELRKKIDEVMAPDPNESRPDRYIVRMCADGRCPFHNRENDLCDIQREIGAEYFGNTCAGYPRRYFLLADAILRSCSSSCPAVIKLLTDDKKAAVMETVTLHETKGTVIQSNADTKNDIYKAPYLQCRPAIIDLFTHILTYTPKNHTISFEDAMMACAEAAKTITENAKFGQGTALLTIIKEFQKKFDKDPSAMSFSKIGTNHRLKFNLINSWLDSQQKAIVNCNAISTDGVVDKEKYEEGGRKFAETFKDRDAALKNIAVNIFLDTFVHLDLKQYTFFEYFSYFSMCCATMQVLANITGYVSENIHDDYIRSVAMLNRNISHNTDRVNKIVTILKKAGITTPLHIAVYVR